MRDSLLKLRVLSGPRAGRQIVVTDTEPVTIGRKAGRVRLHDSRVSKLHAEITLAGGAWVLRDNGSSNGSYVNHDLMRGLAELEPGDLLQFGRVLVKVEQADTLGMMGLDTAPPKAAFDPVQAVPKKGPPRPDTLSDDEDDELDLDALFAAEDGLDSDDDFELPSPKPAAVTPLSKPESPDPDEDDDGVVAPSDPSIAAVKTGKKASVDLLADAGDDADDDPANQTDGEAPEIVSPKLEPDADLIQIDDETPDAGKLPGSTIVLPESMMKTAVGEDAEADDDLSATPAEAVGTADAGDVREELDAGPEPVGEQSDAPANAAPLEPSEATTEAPEPTGPIIERTAAIGADNEETEEAYGSDQVVDDEVEKSLAAPPKAEAISEIEPESEPDVEADTTAEIEVTEPAAEEAGDVVTTATVDAGFVEPELVSDPEASGAPIDVGLDESLPLDTEPPHDFDPEDDLASPAIAIVDTPDADTVAQAAVEPEAITEVEATEEPAIAEAMQDVAAEDEQVDESADQAEAAIAADEPAADLDDEEDAGSAALAPPEPPEPLDDGDAVKPEVADQAENKAPASNHADDAFDIDAAFADLESGLDDEPSKTDAAASSDAPPLGVLDDASGPDQAPPQPGLADGLANSQIDIAFIQDALANLPQVDDQQHPLGLHSQPPISEAPEYEAKDGAAAIAPAEQPQGSAWAIAAELDDDADVSSAAALTQSPANAPVAHAKAEQTLQTPPGINPVTLRDPEEPRSSRVVHPERESVRRFLPAAIILLLVGAGAGYLLANGTEVLTGRPDAAPQGQQTPADPSNAPASNLPVPDPRETENTPNDPAQGPAFEITPNPDPIAPASQQQIGTDQPGIGAAAAPDPFAEGPRILGPLVNPDAPTTTPAGLPSEQVAGPGREGPNLNPVPPALTNPDPDSGNTPAVNPTPGPEPDATADNNPGDNSPAIQEPADGERLVFLVDASGSSIDSLPQMLVWLDQALDNLENPERFTIIFFKQDQAIEVPPGGLKPMTRVLRRTLEREWLSPQGNPVLPSGRSDPTDALTLALSYEPSDIYFLSDTSFARASGDMTREQAVASIIDQLGDSEIRLHGVQFFYQDENQTSALQQLAAHYGGTYEFVAEARQPDQDPIDLLQELENRNR